jgi:3-deoxy-7-phosphoheptulonate synthase
VKTTGNTDVHLVLRGGRRSPNYSREDVARASEGARAAGLAPSLMVDCSHANSRKDPRRQPDVWRSILEQRAAGNHDLVGAMLESNLHFGAQDPNARPLAYGVSITDACMDWETTESLLCEAL